MAQWFQMMNGKNAVKAYLRHIFIICIGGTEEGHKEFQLWQLDAVPRAKYLTNVKRIANHYGIIFVLVWLHETVSILWIYI
jgi:hypothetical protein